MRRGLRPLNSTSQDLRRVSGVFRSTPQPTGTPLADRDLWPTHRPTRRPPSRTSTRIRATEEDQIRGEARGHRAGPRPPETATAAWLFLGRRAGQPLTAATMAPLIRDLGITTVPGRLAALRQLVLQAPAPVVAQAPGFHHTTQRHHAAAGGTWNRYSPRRDTP